MPRRFRLLPGATAAALLLSGWLVSGIHLPSADGAAGDIPVTVYDESSTSDGDTTTMAAAGSPSDTAACEPGAAAARSEPRVLGEAVHPGDHVRVFGLLGENADVNQAHGVLVAYVYSAPGAISTRQKGGPCDTPVPSGAKKVKTIPVRFTRDRFHTGRAVFEVPDQPGHVLMIVAGGRDWDHGRDIETRKGWCYRIVRKP